jgi:hypothetical protein
MGAGQFYWQFIPVRVVERGPDDRDRGRETLLPEKLDKNVN